MVIADDDDDDYDDADADDADGTWLEIAMSSRAEIPILLA